jgi:hypothetical protein
MTSQERLWLNGFATVSQVLAHDRLALEEVRQVLEGTPVADQAWMDSWKAGFNAGILASFGS